MPLYHETVLQEKVAVVFEIGNAYTKVGFAADAFPRFIIPTKVYDVLTRASTNLFEKTTDVIEFYDRVVDYIKMLFFKFALLSPKDRKIVIVETVLCPTIVRETFAKALFCHFEVGSVLFVPTHLVALATIAVDTAVVVDLGYKEGIVVPVYSGVQVLHAWEAQSIGAEAVHNEIKLKLVESGIKEHLLTEDVIEDIKVRTCFVTTLERAHRYRKGEPPTPCPDVEYPVRGDEVITIPGVVRETAFECLFPDDNDKLGLPYIILDCVLKCPLDMRKQLLENLFLIGGTSMIMGLLARLKTELLHLLSTEYYKEKLFTTSIKFHKAPSQANCTAWLGGSIYGGTDLVLTRSLVREEYAKCKHVPDWVNLEDNRGPGSK